MKELPYKAHRVIKIDGEQHQLVFDYQGIYQSTDFRECTPKVNNIVETN